MVLTSEQHAKLAAHYAKPDPNDSPERALWRARLAPDFAFLAKRALIREEANVPLVVSEPLAPY